MYYIFKNESFTFLLILKKNNGGILNIYHRIFLIMFNIDVILITGFTITNLESESIDKRLERSLYG